MKANLNTFPEINCEKKIKALAEAIRLLKNEQSENPTGSIIKNDLGVDCISRTEALKINELHHGEMPNCVNHQIWTELKALPSVYPVKEAEDCISRKDVLRLLNLSHIDSMTKFAFRLQIKHLLSVCPKSDKPYGKYLSIDNVMSVFDDFMCGEVDEEGTETFLEMLKDKAESEDEE